MVPNSQQLSWGVPSMSQPPRWSRTNEKSITMPDTDTCRLQSSAKHIDTTCVHIYSALHGFKTC